MGAYKGDDARYEVISYRVSERELRQIDEFAANRDINRTTAVRMLVNVGIECMEANNASKLPLHNV